MTRLFSDRDERLSPVPPPPSGAARRRAVGAVVALLQGRPHAGLTGLSAGELTMLRQRLAPLVDGVALSLGSCFEGLEEDRGPSIRLFSGHDFWPLSPRVEDVRPEDIAHSAAITNRWGGHSVLPMPVAQHGILVADLLESLGCPAVMVLAGGLHDGAESYVGDMIRPLKLVLPEFDAIHDAVLAVVGERFGVDPSLFHSQALKRADDIILATEARDLMRGPPFTSETPLPQRVEPWGWEEAERRYLEALERWCAAAGVSL